MGDLFVASASWLRNAGLFLPVSSLWRGPFCNVTRSNKLGGATSAAAPLTPPIALSPRSLQKIPRHHLRSINLSGAPVAVAP